MKTENCIVCKLPAKFPPQECTRGEGRGERYMGGLLGFERAEGAAAAAAKIDKRASQLLPPPTPPPPPPSILIILCFFDYILNNLCGAALFACSLALIMRQPIPDCARHHHHHHREQRQQQHCHCIHRHYHQRHHREQVSRRLDDIAQLQLRVPIFATVHVAPLSLSLSLIENPLKVSGRKPRARSTHTHTSAQSAAGSPSKGISTICCNLRCQVLIQAARRHSNTHTHNYTHLHSHTHNYTHSLPLLLPFFFLFWASFVNWATPKPPTFAQFV